MMMEYGAFTRVPAEANTMLSQVVLHTSALPEEPEAGAALQMDASIDTT